MLRVLVAVLSVSFLVGCFGRNSSSDFSRGIGNGGGHARDCYKNGSRTTCGGGGEDHGRDDNGGGWPGDGGGNGGGNCRQQKFCDQFKCEDRTVCDPLVMTTTKRPWGEEFGLSQEAVQKLDHVLAVSRTGDPSALLSIGLSEQDAKRMMHFQLPTDTGIRNVAQAFGITSNQSRELFAFMISAVRMQAQDISSPLWRQCMSTGHWVTLENNNCRKTFWKGCSPETGATMCLAQ